MKRLRLAFSLSMVTVLPACTALVQRNVEPARVVRDEHPFWIVIGTTAGEEMVLRSPQLIGTFLGAWFSLMLLAAKSS